MTYSGMQFIDLFIDALNVKKKSGEKVISDKNAEIVRLVYDFENNRIRSYAEVAISYGLTRERIRQLVIKTIAQIGFVLRRQNQSVVIDKLNRFRESIVESSDRQMNEYKIFCFWEENLIEYPASRICLLIYLIVYPTTKLKSDFRELIAKWKREKYEAEKARLRKIRRKKYTELVILKNQDTILKQVIWFENIRKWANFDKEKYHPKRTVVQKDEYISGSFSSIKCNRDIQYESGIELASIKQLESFPKVEWYSEQPTTIFYQETGKEKRYTPDFAVMLDTKEIFLVEIKQTLEMLDYRVLRKMNRLTDYCEENGFGILLTDGKKTINDLCQRRYYPDLAKEILERLNENGGRTIFSNEIKNVLQSHNSGINDLLPIVLKHKLTFYPYPFKLTNRYINCRFLEIASNHHHWSDT